MCFKDTQSAILIGPLGKRHIVVLDEMLPREAGQFKLDPLRN